MMGLAMLTLCGGIYAAPPDAAYQLVWADEFEGAELDRQAWSYRVDAKWDTAHRPENVVVADGKLKLILEQRANDGMTHTTGGVITKRAFRYGYYETRMKGWPDANWHPSFWTVHAFGLQTFGGLPEFAGLGGSDRPRLEVDFFEHDTNKLNQFHCGAIRWGPQGRLSRGRKHVTGLPDLSQAFHVFGCELLPDKMRVYFDGDLVNTVRIDDLPQPDNFVLLTSIGRDIDNSKLPGTVEFDYFRFYAKLGQALPEYRLKNAETGQIMRTDGLEVIAPAALVVADDEPLYREDRWQWVDAGAGRGRLRNSDSALTLSGRSFTGADHLVVVDFNDMNTGGLSNPELQPSGTGTGFSDPYWMANTGIPLVADGDLTPPPATLYQAAQGAGNTRYLSHLSFADSRAQARALSVSMGGAVWFSFLVEPRDLEDRLGIMFNNGTSYAAENHRILVIGSDLLVDPETGSQARLDGVFTLEQTHLVVGRLSLGAGLVEQDRIQIWVDPVLTAGQGLGAAVLDEDVGMLPNSGTRIESLHLVGYGVVAESGRLDALRLSDSPEVLDLDGGQQGAQALLDVTGVAAFEAALPVSSEVNAIAYSGSDPDQEFELVDAGGSFVRVRQVPSGQVLRATGSDVEPEVTLSENLGDDRERWLLVDANPLERMFVGFSPLPNGWMSTWMGDLFGKQFPWVYHRQMGWIKLEQGGEDTVRIFHPVFGWLVSRLGDFPCVWSAKHERWGVIDWSDETGFVTLVVGATSSNGGWAAEAPVDWQAVVESADYSTVNMPTTTPGAEPEDPSPSFVPPSPFVGDEPSLVVTAPVAGLLRAVVRGGAGQELELISSPSLLDPWSNAGGEPIFAGVPVLVRVPVAEAPQMFFRVRVVAE